MTIKIDVYLHNHHAEVLELLRSINLKVNTMANELSDLQAAVARESSVVDSAVTLLQGLKAALDAAIAGGNPAALAALSADIGAKTDALAAAVAANTPAQ